MVIENSYHIISLGCAKNTVDSSAMATILDLSNFHHLDEPDDAKFIIVNTCGFISSARQESIQLLKNVGLHKNRGQYLIAAGCLSERWKDELGIAVPTIDGILSTRNWHEISHIINQIRKIDKKNKPYLHLNNQQSDVELIRNIPRIAIQGTSAYLKIADGCRHNCAFCAIPIIKGTKKSRPMEDIIRDAQLLQDQGIQEINIIAQDSTDYGFDLGLRDGLAALVEKMLPEIPDIPWIRILYAFPGSLSSKLIDIMAGSDQVLPYLDLPLQHAHPDILRKMQRPANLTWVYDTVANLRDKIPEIALRTTFIVGFPGETEAEFTYLMDFVKKIEFDHLGAFTYSLEKNTPAEPLGDPIPNEVKLKRMERLMLLQEEISARKNAQLSGSNMEVIIEGSSEGISVGRTYRDAPEIDGLVFIDSELEVGKIYNVTITGVMGVHDLLASI